MLSKLVSLDLQLRRDGGRPAAELAARDRTLGQDLGASARNPAAALAAWVEHAQRPEDAQRSRRILAALRSVGLLVAVAGMILGIGAAAAVYFYDGSRPINILPALAVFVVLPVLGLAPLVLQFLPRLPGIASLQETLLALGGGLIAGAMRLLPQRQRQLLEEIFGQGQAHHRVFAEVHRWTLLGWSQGFAVAFHLGAIAWLMTRVLVTDLSFTWSTTAEFVTADRVHGFTALLSTPWSAWWPGAVPSLQDVAATQYFRLGEGTLAEGASPATLGRWWQFLLAGMLVYGLLPRLVSTAACALRRARAVRWAMLHLPGALDTLDRLTAARVATQARTPEIEAPGLAEAARTGDAPAGALDDRQAIVVNWSQVPIDPARWTTALARQLGVSVHTTFEAGAGSSLDEDARVQDAITDSVSKLDPQRALLVVLVKSWEPATLEAMDFLADLRAPLGDGFRIVVAAVRTQGEGNEASFQQWRHRVTAAGDPWLRAVDLPVDGPSSAKGADRG